VEFRRDSYVCSFGDAAGFDEEKYLAWLTCRIAEFPQGHLHVWQNDRIVGQIEMRPRGTPAVGYISLFYLIPHARGSGLSEALHNHAVEVFGSLGILKLQLSVSPSNSRAVAFYRKHGWQDLGLRPGHDNVHLMELQGAGQRPALHG
jgi:ribosomal protein S18 acetylase RimI-like enzyme